jgi:polyisoprenyl-teichoic acid--peptidoglycan teichoic acid transferase
MDDSTRPIQRPPQPKRSRRLWIVVGLLAMLLVGFAGGLALAGARAAQVAGLTPPDTATLAIPVTHPPTATATPDYSPTPGPSPTASDTPTITPTPSVTPTARRKTEPTLWLPFTPEGPLTTEIPPPAARYEFDKDTINILLLGSDIGRQDINVGRGYQTDTIIVASINRKDNYVSLLSIPRDLYVYLPGVRMSRINTADQVGKTFFPGGGPAYLEQVILYNLGIPIDYYARINFQGFKDIVDTVGGIDIPVTCAIQDWRLISPDLDPQVEDNWYLYTQETGVVHMDGDLALWYARSRKNNTDFDRSRRQMQVLRAIYQKGKSLNILPQIPALFDQFKDVIQTDMGIGDVLQFVPMAANVDTSRIHTYSINAAHVDGWTTTDDPPESVLLLRPDVLSWLLPEAFDPPATIDNPTFVEVWNGTPNKDWFVLAADDLRARGFVGVEGQADRQDYTTEVLYDFTDGTDTDTLALLKKTFGVSNDNVISQPDPNAPYPYRIVLGADWNSCIYNVPPPKPTPTP